MKLSPATIALCASAFLSSFVLNSCRSTLYSAARDGDIQTVRNELAEGADPSGKASAANRLWQIPAIIVSIPIDLVRTVGPLTLIEPIFDPGWKKETDSNGQPTLTFDSSTYLTKIVINFGEDSAIKATTNSEVITELLLAGAEGSDWDKTKAVSEAARKGDAITLQKLLQKGCQANRYFTSELSPLMLAIANGHEECARILLANGASFNDTAGKDNTLSCYEVAQQYNQMPLYKKLGGSLEFAPASIQGCTLNVDYSQANSKIGGSSSKHDFVDCTAEEIRGMRNKGIEKTTFLQQGKIKGNEYELYKYTKASSNKALITLYASDMEEPIGRWELTFISPTRAKMRYWYTGGDVDVVYYSNLSVTISR